MRAFKGPADVRHAALWARDAAGGARQLARGLSRAPEGRPRPAYSATMTTRKTSASKRRAFVPEMTSVLLTWMRSGDVAVART